MWLRVMLVDRNCWLVVGLELVVGRNLESSRCSSSSDQVLVLLGLCVLVDSWSKGH